MDGQLNPEPISKVKLSVAGNTFEAEGPEAAVADRFTRWVALIEKALAAPETPSTRRSDTAQPADGRSGATPPPTPTDDITAEQLAKLFSLDERRGLVWLRVPVEDAGDAALTTLYGFRVLRQMDDVTAVRLAEAMTQAGQGVPRLDRPLAQHMRERLILGTGQRRGRRYRLTATGTVRARRILDELLTQLP